MKAAPLFWIVTAFLLAPSVWAQRVIYVDTDAVGANDGSSWTNAFVFLQDALAVTQDGDEVWVAEGVYRPDQGAGLVPGDREASFEIRKGISLFGGFAGSETSPDDRDWGDRWTVLSGDLLGNDDNVIEPGNPLRADNSSRMIEITDVTWPVVIDGLSIEDGTAEGALGDRSGGAIIISVNPPASHEIALVVISRCRFAHNVFGGGWTIRSDIASVSGHPALTVRVSELRDNFGTGIVVGSGGAVLQGLTISGYRNRSTVISGGSSDLYLFGSTIAFNEAITPISFTPDEQRPRTLYIWNSRFIGNTTRWGTVKMTDANLFSVNNLFIGNTSEVFGSAIYAYRGTYTVINSVFAYNRSLKDGTVFVSEGTNTRISNSIFWANDIREDSEFFSWGIREDHVGIDHSIIQYPLPSHARDGSGLMGGDPLFADPLGPDGVPGTLDDDYRLSAISPAIDAGQNGSLLFDSFDLDEDGRVYEHWPTDLVGNTRVVDGGTRWVSVDMGAYEFGAPPVGTSIFPEWAEVPTRSDRFDVYPNPTTGASTMEWHLPSVSHAKVVLVDMMGSRLRTLYTGSLPVGAKIALDLVGQAPGLYLVWETSTGLASPVAIIRQ